MKKELSHLTRSILWRTGLGRKTAALFWQIHDDNSVHEELLTRQESVFDNLPTDFEDPAFSSFIKADSARWSLQTEYVIGISDVLLEPERLLGVSKFNELVEQTVMFKHDRQFPYILPYLLNRHSAKPLEQAILYDGSATRNYYHHFVDALSSLTLLDRVDLPPGLPLLVNRFVYEQPFFQYLYQKSQSFRSLNWRVVEPNEWLRVGKLYKLQALHFGKETWRQMRQVYELPNNKPTRRVFLNRDRNQFGRYLTNEKEVVGMLAKYGFENMFAEHLSISEQAAMFAETEYLVALTGAGLIQQFYMQPDYGHIIEIMPANRLMPEYYWQGYTLGMRYYDVIVGGNMQGGKDYPVDIQQLEVAVARMLTNTSETPVYGKTQMRA